MKTILASAAAVSLLASASFAGTLVEPEMEPMVEVMQEEDNGSSNALLLPLLALAALAAIASSGSSTSGT